MAKGQIKQKLTPETVTKLEYAFSIDASVEEACFYADISRETYYRWTKEDKELYDKFERLRNKPILKARETVANKISESYQNAMDYLKRKRKIEFGDNVDITSGNKPLPIANVFVDVPNSNEHKEDSTTQEEA